MLDEYNNIGISLFSILSVIKNYELLDYSKTTLILPLTLNNAIVNFLSDGRTTIRGLEDLLQTKIEYFLDFDDKYLKSLPNTMNILMLAEQMHFVRLNRKIYPQYDQISKIDFNHKELGNRWTKINKSIPNIITILDESTESIFFKLRIEL